jgi:hypothetical protein
VTGAGGDQAFRLDCTQGVYSTNRRTRCRQPSGPNCRRTSEGNRA